MPRPEGHRLTHPRPVVLDVRAMGSLDPSPVHSGVWGWRGGVGKKEGWREGKGVAGKKSDGVESEESEGKEGEESNGMDGVESEESKSVENVESKESEDSEDSEESKGQRHTSQ